MAFSTRDYKTFFSLIPHMLIGQTDKNFLASATTPRVVFQNKVNLFKFRPNGDDGTVRSTRCFRKEALDKDLK
jgi:hypothetical protein